MRDVHVWIGAITVGANALAAAIGAVAWLLWANPKIFWLTLRAGQVLVIVSAVIGSILLLEGRDLPRLHLVYALTWYLLCAMTAGAALRLLRERE